MMHFFSAFLSLIVGIGIPFFFIESTLTTWLPTISQSLTILLWVLTIPLLIINVSLSSEQLILEKKHYLFLKNLSFFLPALLIFTLFLSWLSMGTLSPTRIPLFILPEDSTSSGFSLLQALSYLFPQSFADVLSFYHINFYFLLALFVGIYVNSIHNARQEFHLLQLGFSKIFNSILSCIYSIGYIWFIPFIAQLSLTLKQLFSNSAVGFDVVYDTGALSIFRTWLWQYSGLTLVISFIIFPMVAFLLKHQKNLYIVFYQLKNSLITALITGNSLITFSVLQHQWEKASRGNNRSGIIIIFIVFFLVQIGNIILGSLLFFSVIRYYSPMSIPFLELSEMIVILQVAAWLPFKNIAYPLMSLLSVAQIFSLGGNISPSFIASIAFFIPLAQRLALFMNTAFTIFCLNHHDEAMKN